MRARLSEDVLARVRELEQEQLDGFEAWYRSALDRGEANAEVAPELAAHYIDTLFTTILTQMMLDQPPELITAQARLAARALTP